MPPKFDVQIDIDQVYVHSTPFQPIVPRNWYFMIGTTLLTCTDYFAVHLTLISKLLFFDPSITSSCRFQCNLIVITHKLCIGCWVIYTNWSIFPVCRSFHEAVILFPLRFGIVPSIPFPLSPCDWWGASDCADSHDCLFGSCENPDYNWWESLSI